MLIRDTNEEMRSKFVMHTNINLYDLISIFLFLFVSLLRIKGEKI